MKKVLFVIFITYVSCGLLLNSPLYSLCVLRPSRQTKEELLESIHGADRQALKIDRPDGAPLSAVLFIEPDSKELVLVHHGRGGNLFNRLFLAQQLINQKLSVLIYDYQGYGDSAGEVGLRQLISDGLAAHDFVVNRLGYKPNQIITYGESLGTGVACEVAKERVCKAIVLQSPFTSLPEEAKDSFPLLFLYPDWLFPKPRFENLVYVKQTHPPLLIIHGAMDQRIPVKHAVKLFNESLEPKQLVLLPNAGHNNVGGVDFEMYTEALRKFFKTVRKTH